MEDLERFNTFAGLFEFKLYFRYQYIQEIYIVNIEYINRTILQTWTLSLGLPLKL